MRDLLSNPAAHIWINTILIPVVGFFIDYRNSRRTSEIHILINSRMTELVNSSRAAAKAEGIVEGTEDTNKRRDAKESGHTNTVRADDKNYKKHGK